MVATEVGRRVGEVLGALVVLEGLVMLDVVGDSADYGRDCGTGAAGGSVGIGDAQIEAAMEPSPGDAGCVEQVTDVLAGHAGRGAGGADIAGRVGVADEREAAVAVRNDVNSRLGKKEQLRWSGRR